MCQMLLRCFRRIEVIADWHTSYFHGVVRRKAYYKWVEERKAMERANKSNYIQKCCNEGEEEKEVIVERVLEKGCLLFVYLLIY